MSPYEKGFKDGLSLAAAEIKNWRDLQIKAFKENKYTNPKEAARETQNTLNLLDVIELNLLERAGMDRKEAWKMQREYEKVEYP